MRDVCTTATTRVLVAVALLHAASSGVEAQTAAASTIKAAFLYNFAKFAEWPAAALAPGQRLDLCVIGDNAVAEALEQTIKGRAHEGHELTVQILKLDGPLRWCHLLYVDGRDAERSIRVIEALRGAPVLTVGDGSRFAENGGVAQLILEHDRMRFAINVSAADRARLRLSSKLLGLAKIVKDKPDGTH
jgi:hypothetical protein